MPKGSLNVSLKGADDIFSTEESRQEQQREQVQQIPIGELFPFKNHPFKVLDDESMQRTVESVEQYGVLSPLIARPRPEGGYEIISGHRRQHAAQLAGLDALPVIVRQMDDDSETAKLVAEYEAFGVTYDAEKDQWYFNGEEVRYFRDVLTSNGESLTSGKFRGEMRTLGSGVGTIDIYTVRDYGHLNSEHHGTLTGIEKYSQEEFDEHTQAGMSGNQPIGNASHN